MQPCDPQTLYRADLDSAAREQGRPGPGDDCEQQHDGAGTAQEDSIEDDANNNDTFGDCGEVGDDWTPDALQDAFEREHAEQNAERRGQGSFSSQQPPPLLPPPGVGSTPPPLLPPPGVGSAPPPPDPGGFFAPPPGLAFGPKAAVAVPTAAVALSLPDMLPMPPLHPGTVAPLPPLPPYWIPPGPLPHHLHPCALPSTPMPPCPPPGAMGGSAAAALPMPGDGVLAGPLGALRPSAAAAVHPLGSLSLPPTSAGTLAPHPAAPRPAPLPGSGGATAAPGVAATFRGSALQDLLRLGPPQAGLPSTAVAASGPPALTIQTPYILSPSPPPLPQVAAHGAGAALQGGGEPATAPKVMSVAELESRMLKDVGVQPPPAPSPCALPLAAALGPGALRVDQPPYPLPAGPPPWHPAAAAVAALMPHPPVPAHSGVGMMGPPPLPGLAAGFPPPWTEVPPMPPMPLLPPPDMAAAAAAAASAAQLDAIRGTCVSAAAAAGASVAELAAIGGAGVGSRAAPPPGMAPAEVPPTVTAAAFIAPFTKNHRALIVRQQASLATQRFMRHVGQLPSHPGLMNNSDKELIARIQLGQLAATASSSQSVQNYRASYMPRVGVLGNQHENNPTIPSSSIGGVGSGPPTSRETSTLVARLQETILFAGPPPGGGAAAEDSVSVAATSALPALSPGVTSLSSPVGSEEAAEIPPSSGSGGGGSCAAVPDASIAPATGAAAERPSLAMGAYWQTQFELESAYNKLLDLEQLSCVLAGGGDKLNEKQRDGLLAERAALLDQVGRQLFDGIGVGFEGGDETAKGVDCMLVVRSLDYRKGRLLLSRLLVCIAPSEPSKLAIAPGGAADPAALSLLWELVRALLRAPSALLRLATSGRSSDSGSWWKLLCRLAQSLRVACMEGGGQAGQCAGAIAALLAGHEGTLSSVCALKQVVVLLRLLLDGCRSGREVEGAAAAVEDVLSTLIEEICSSLPALYEVATWRRRTTAAAATAVASVGGAEGGPAATVAAPAAEEAPSPAQAPPATPTSDAPRPPSMVPAEQRIALPEVGEPLKEEDLWAMLISMTEQANEKQKRRIHTLVGPFVSDLSSPPTAGEGGAGGETPKAN